MKLRGNPPVRAGDVRSRGRFYTRSTKGGPVVEKWPKPQGPAKTPWRFYQQTEFGLAAKMAAQASAIDLVNAQYAVAGTDMLPRDWLMQCAMGVGFTFVLADGTEIQGARLTNPNSQYVLDGVTDVVGSIIYRAPIGWVGLPPGNAGQFLNLDADALPAWIDAGTSLAYVAGNWTPVFSTSGAVPTGVTYGSRVGRYLNFPAAKLCWVSGFVVLTNKGAGGTGNIRITGLPFAAENVANQNQTFGGWTAPIAPGAGVPANGWELLPNLTLASPVCYGNGAGPAYVTWAQANNISRFALEGFYKTV